MILCDTEIRTYVLQNKGQPVAARKKWDFLDFPVGLPNLRCRKSGTSWVWKLMEALENKETDSPSGINRMKLAGTCSLLKESHEKKKKWDSYFWGVGLLLFGWDSYFL